MDPNDPFQFEEDYHTHSKRASRKERKMASARDRSKYKKSDQDQLKKRAQKPQDSSLTRGRVLGITPEGVLVSYEDQIVTCALRGSLKKEKTHYKNLVAVGDFVHIKEKMIHFVEERHSILARADNLSRKKKQLIAVNIDQVFITGSVVFPALKPFLIDRYIIAAKKGNMEPVIVINKIDLLQERPSLVDPVTWEEEKSRYEEFKEHYSQLGYGFFEVSSKTGEGLERLKKAMEGKASVFSGQSGVGKSSLINAMLNTQQAIGDLTTKTFKGSHTTTTTHLIPMEHGGFCIDTPGITSFGIWKLDKTEVSSYFPDIVKVGEQCKFLDCTHVNEPDCAVIKAVEEGSISSLRFASYCALIMELDEEHKQR